VKFDTDRLRLIQEPIPLDLPRDEAGAFAAAAATSTNGVTATKIRPPKKPSDDNTAESSESAASANPKAPSSVLCSHARRRLPLPQRGSLCTT
jgi:hypothetical protein